ncbi:hypothetical protein, partial [Stenotrophomonas pictorum]
PEPEPEPPLQTLTGTYSGFASSFSGGRAALGGSAQLVFDVTAGTFSARIAPMQWEGAAYEVVDGQYVSNTEYGASNSYGTLQVAVEPALLCDCDYLSWGHWEAFVPANGTEYSAEHGYWIVGNVTPAAQLPTDIVASYSGHALGAVSDGVSDTRTVRGDFSATVDFATGTGSLQISNFDGRTFGDSNLDINNMALPGTPDGAFAGSLMDDQNSSLSGGYSAGFASDGEDKAAAMFGTFQVEEGEWSASGIFGGNRDAGAAK